MYGELFEHLSTMTVVTMPALPNGDYVAPLNQVNIMLVADSDSTTIHVDEYSRLM